MTNAIPQLLITAAGGKVGQHVAQQLSEKGIAARAGFRSQDKARALQLPGIEGVVLDFESPETITAAFKGIHALFLVTPGSPFAARQEEGLLAEAKRAGVSRVVKLSGKIAEHHKVGFGVWNKEAERQITDSGIPYTILRGNFFMQNLFGSAEQIKQGAFTMGPATKKIALLDTRDIAAVVVAALTEPGHTGQTYDLNGPELLNGHAQAAVFSDALGRPIKYIDVSANDFIENLKKFGLPDWLIEAFGVAAADAEVPGDQSSVTVEQLLGRRPGSLARFVEDYRAVFEA
jgi:uncharacterized protein YbjT (DUF2867 family)